MLTRYGVSQILADARYLRKDAAAADQTISGAGTVTISNYNYTWTNGNIIVGGTARVTGLSTLTGGFTANTGSTINPVANAGLNVPLSGSTNGTGATFLGTVVSVRSLNGFVEMSSDFNSSSRGSIYFGNSSTNYGYVVWDQGNTRTRFGSNNNGLYAFDTGAANLGLLVSLGSGGTVIPVITSQSAAGANTGFTFNATNGPNILAVLQSAGTTRCTFDATGFTFRWNGNGPTTSPTISLGRNSSSANDFEMIAVGAAAYVFSNSVQGDITIRNPATTNAILIGPAGAAEIAPWAITATHSGSTLVTSALTAGAVPASVAVNGTAATNPSLTGSAGGASSGVTGQTGGTGSTWTITGGVGGAVAGAGGIGGAGGATNLTAGNGGNGATTGGAGGGVTITAGNAGTGGNANGGSVTLANGTATGTGTAGSLVVTGGNFTVTAAGNTVIGSSGPTLSKAATSAALSVRNATATLADLNLNVLGADPGTLQDGDFWIKNAAGVRTLNARIAGVSYSVQIS